MTFPTFLICGAQKAGTTALHSLMDQHPNVLMSNPKETHYFSYKYHKGSEYLESAFNDYSDEYAVGEASPSTMISEEAPARIKKEIPDAKLIFVLRNPIERALSHYYFFIYNDFKSTKTPFNELIKGSSEFREAILRHGFYDKQIKKFDTFFSSENMKIIIYEDFKKDGKETVEDLFDFVGVSPNYDTVIERHNTTQYTRSPEIYFYMKQIWRPIRALGKRLFPNLTDLVSGTAKNVVTTNERPPMSPEARAYLRDVYKETIDWTRERTGRPLTHWR